MAALAIEKLDGDDNFKINDIELLACGNCLLINHMPSHVMVHGELKGGPPLEPLSIWFSKYANLLKFGYLSILAGKQLTLLYLVLKKLSSFMR